MTISRTFQWYRHPGYDPSVSSTAISGATASSYTTVAADVNNYLHMRETASNSLGSASANSNVVGPITAAGQTFTPEPGAIAPIETLFGNRPVQPRIKPFWELDIWMAEVANAEALHKEMCDDITPQLFTETIASGRWSDSTIWSNGVPGAGMSACINAGHDVVYDVESSVQLRYVTNHGRLRWDVTKDTKLVCDTIHSHFGSYFEIGTHDNPLPESSTAGKPRANIVFIPTSGPGATGKLGAMWMGEVQIWGADKTEKVDVSDINAGATTFTVNSSFDISAWKVGDDILALSRSQFTNESSSDPTYKGATSYSKRLNTNNPFDGDEGPGGTYKLNGQDETRRITGIDYTNRVVTVNSAFTYSHLTRRATRTWKDGTTPTLPARVCNISRSVSFSSGAADITNHQNRAHSMAMYCDRVQIHSAQFVDMGRTDIVPDMTAPLSTDGRAGRIWLKDQSGPLPMDPNNVRGRYPVHAHFTGADFTRNQCVFEKLVVKTSGTYPIPGWGITHHNSRLSINHCVVYNVRGAGIVSEAGTEIGQWIGNTVAWCRGNGFTPDYNRFSGMQNRQGGSGVGYDNQSRNMFMHDNEFTTCRIGWVYLESRNPGLDVEGSADHTAMRYFHPVMAGAQGGGYLTPWQASTDLPNAYAPFGNFPTWMTSQYGNQQQQIPHLSKAYGCDFSEFIRIGGRDGIHRNDKTPALFTEWIAYGGGAAFSATNYTWFYYWKHCAFFGGRSTDNAYSFGTHTVQFAFRDLVIEDYNDFGGPPECWLHGGQFIDVNMPYTAPLTSYATADGHDDGTQGVYNSSNLTYIAPSFTMKPNDGTHLNQKLTMDWLEQGGAYSSIITFWGTVTDTFGTYNWPEWITIGTAGGTSMYSSTTPEDTVKRNGCFFDTASSTWKSRLWFAEIDRALPDGNEIWWINVDITLTNFPTDFLARYSTSAPPAHPVTPLPPESIKKPFTAISAATNSVAPFISGGNAVAGNKLWVEYGTWSTKPNDPDSYSTSWQLDGVEATANSRYYTIQASDVGKTLTCVVSALNAAGSTSVRTAGLAVVAMPTTPQAIFGGNLREIWDGSVHVMSDTDAAGNKLPGLWVKNQLDCYYWTGQVNKTVLFSDTTGDGLSIYHPLNWEPVGWKGTQGCVRGMGKVAFQRGIMRWTAPSLTNPHIWIVTERPNEDQETAGSGDKTVVNVSNFFGVNMWSASVDSAQNRLTLTGNNATSIDRTDFSKTTRGIIYAGRDSQGVAMALNNSGLVRNAAPAVGTQSNVEIDILGYNYANLRIKAIVLIDQDGVTPTQLSQMHTYLTTMFL